MHPIWYIFAGSVNGLNESKEQNNINKKHNNTAKCSEKTICFVKQHTHITYGLSWIIYMHTTILRQHNPSKCLVFVYSFLCICCFLLLLLLLLLFFYFVVSCVCLSSQRKTMHSKLRGNGKSSMQFIHFCLFIWMNPFRLYVCGVWWTTAERQRKSIQEWCTIIITLYKWMCVCIECHCPLRIRRILLMRNHFNYACFIFFPYFYFLFSNFRCIWSEQTNKF